MKSKEDIENKIKDLKKRAFELSLIKDVTPKSMNETFYINTCTGILEWVLRDKKGDNNDKTDKTEHIQGDGVQIH